MLCRSAPFTRPLGCKVINDRVIPRNADQMKVQIFVYNAYQVFLCVPAVKEDDHIFLFCHIQYPRGTDR